jgi:LmbE family N-acetylglucosaminyl deacetylase
MRFENACHSGGSGVPAVEAATFFAGSGLVLAPHFDDEVLACGGTLALLPQKAQWHVAYATDGRRSPEPTFPWWDKVDVDLAVVRRDESQAAMACLGIPAANLHFLDLPEGRLAGREAELDRALRSLLGKLQPDHVLVPFRYDRHRDHLALNRVMMRLLDSGFYSRPLTEYFVYYRSRLLPAGDVRRYIRPALLQTIEITSVTARKRAALECFQSQTTRFFEWQMRPNLTAELLDGVSAEPECFLRYEPARPSSAIFSHAVPWIRAAHWLEPILKKRKDRIMAYWRRAGRRFFGDSAAAAIGVGGRSGTSQ